MARRNRDGDDDDDVDIPPRVGRPRLPEEHGPRKPWAHEQETYWRRMQAILDALEIPDIGRDERLYLQRIMWRADLLLRFDARRFRSLDGDAQVIMILRSIAETTNGLDALTLPIIQAVAACMHEAWTDRGLQWLSAMDDVPLLEIRQTLRALGLEDQLSNAIRWRLTPILGPPVSQAKPKKKPARQKTARPPCVSEQTRAEVLSMRKKRPKARMAAA